MAHVKKLPRPGAASNPESGPGAGSAMALFSNMLTLFFAAGSVPEDLTVRSGHLFV